MKELLRLARSGRLDRNTPAAHRVHHSSATRHRDRNLGAITLPWDHVSGTYARAAAPRRYGIRGARAPSTLAGLYLDPWLRWLHWRAERGAASTFTERR